MSVTVRAHLATALFLVTSVAQAQATTQTAAKTLAAKIDERIAKRWKDQKVQPATSADDAEFMRRVYLDLIGRIPSAGETGRFLNDKAPNKRDRLIEDLLNSPRYR